MKVEELRKEHDPENHGEFSNENYLAMFSYAKVLKHQKKELVDVLNESKLQIEYLHEKFKETGSGNSVLSRINETLKNYE